MELLGQRVCVFVILMEGGKLPSVKVMLFSIPTAICERVGSLKAVI